MQFHGENRRAVAEYRLSLQPIAIPRAGHGMQREAGQEFVARQILDGHALGVAAAGQQEHARDQY